MSQIISFSADRDFAGDLEGLIEKATELGVKEIHPLVAEHCTKRTVNIERCKKIIIASAKQCQRSHFPVIKEPKTMVEWLNKPRKQCFAGVIGAKGRLKKFNYNKTKDFYMVGGMGHTSSVAFGYSLANNKKTICIDGDGSFLMHLGSIKTLGTFASNNLKYIL